VLLTGITGIGWWVLARLVLCLAAIDEAEIARLLLVRLRWMVITCGAAAFLVVLAGQMVGAPAGPAKSVAVNAEFAEYAGAGVLLLAALALWVYSRFITRRARADRNRVPEVCKGVVRRVLTAREGGSPVLLRCQSGRWMWVTGSSQVVAPLRERLARSRQRFGFRLSVTLVYHPKSRVVKEVPGMAVEAVDAVWSDAPDASGLVLPSLGETWRCPATNELCLTHPESG
jgi:hypothetical protein